MYQSLVNEIDNKLNELNFQKLDGEKYDDINIISVFHKDKIIATYVAIIVDLTDSPIESIDDLNNIKERIRSYVSERIKSKWFSRESGASIILLVKNNFNEDIMSEMKMLVDKTGFHSTIIQSIFLIIQESDTKVSYKTWGLIVSGKYIKKIEEGINNYISSYNQ